MFFKYVGKVWRPLRYGTTPPVQRRTLKSRETIDSSDPNPVVLIPLARYSSVSIRIVSIPFIHRTRYLRRVILTLSLSITLCCRYLLRGRVSRLIYPLDRASFLSNCRKEQEKWRANVEKCSGTKTYTAPGWNWYFSGYYFKRWRANGERRPCYFWFRKLHLLVSTGTLASSSSSESSSEVQSVS